MFTRTITFASAACLGLALIASQAAAQTATPGADGLIKVKSAYSADRQPQFAMASGVVESITSSVRAK